MLYVLLNDAGRAIGATTEPIRHNRNETRNDWKSLARAEEVAAQLTESTGERYIGTDAGPNVSPRYDVIKAPSKGDKVSKAFNGDSYPEGEIVQISKSLRRIKTSTGEIFFRRGQSGSWIAGGTWSMIRGHESRRNPSL